MTTALFDNISTEKPHDHEAIEHLCEAAFGPGRFTRTAFRLREGISHIVELSFVLKKDEELLGSVRQTEIRVGSHKVLLLGPLVVKPEHKRLGYGQALMEKAVFQSRKLGHSAILLVGDLPYYARFGFIPVPHGTITMPGPVDPDRLLICYLNDTIQAITGKARSAPFAKPGCGKTSQQDKKPQ